MKEKVIVVIPARMDSSRFPGKPIVQIIGLPMIEHVRRRALLAEGIDDVVVATCDEAIMDVVKKNGGKAVMTSAHHERASERVAEAMLNLEGDIVVVAQGDEPTLLPETLTSVAQPLVAYPDIDFVSLLSPLEGEKDFSNPNIVKAACGLDGNILFFSRAPIPYRMKKGEVPIFRETGIRAFRKDSIQKYITLPETPFEKVESIDMLRLIEHGYRIKSVITKSTTLGVDLKEDVDIVEKVLKEDSIQKELHRRIL